MAMIATTMRSSIRVKILVFTLETRTEEQKTLTVRRSGETLELKKEEARQSGIDAAGMKLLFHKSSL